MTQLNQIIAIANGVKKDTESVKSQAYHLFSKPDLFNGLEKTYQPLDAEGSHLPPESKIVQTSTDTCVGNVRDALERLFDIVYTQDTGNTVAKADVEVEGEVIAKDVPAVTLLFIEKQLVDLQTFFQKVPVLDMSCRWNHDSNNDLWVSDEVKRHRTTKVSYPIVLYPATPEHPAQTQMATKDVIEGHWTEKRISGAWTVVQREKVLARVVALKEAVVKAREKANSSVITDMTIGKNIMKFLLG